jgi:DHA2 family multidrug resistance protein-like MFS transporter
MVPLPLGIMIAAFVSGRLVNRYSSAWLCGAGLIILAGGAILLSLMQPGVSTFLIVLAAAVCGIGFGIFQVPNNHSMLATAPHSRSGAASAMLSLSRLIGQTLGALMAALLFRKIGAQSGAPIVAAALIAIGVASATLLRKGRSRSTIVE